MLVFLVGVRVSSGDVYGNTEIPVFFR